MASKFISIDDFLFSIETQIINFLYDYDLLKKFDKNVKKIIFYFFVKNFCESLTMHSDLLFHHDRTFSKNHELFIYFDHEKLIPYLNKICIKLKKLTNHIFYTSNKNNIPDYSIIDELDGSIIDEIMTLKLGKPVNFQQLKNLLNENNLKDLFDSLGKKIS